MEPLLSELLDLEDGGVNWGRHPQGRSAMTDMMGRMGGPEFPSRTTDTRTGFRTLKHRKQNQVQIIQKAGNMIDRVTHYRIQNPIQISKRLENRLIVFKV